jgi:hypothetical protein
MQGRGWNLVKNQPSTKEGRIPFSPIRSNHQQARLSLGGAPLEVPKACDEDPVDSVAHRAEESIAFLPLENSSDEDTCDEAYLRRHLPYEMCEREHSVRVYADGSCLGSSVNSPGSMLDDLSGMCSFAGSTDNVCTCFVNLSIIVLNDELHYRAPFDFDLRGQPSRVFRVGPCMTLPSAYSKARAHAVIVTGPKREGSDGRAQLFFNVSSGGSVVCCNPCIDVGVLCL